MAHRKPPSLAEQRAAWAEAALREIADKRLTAEKMYEIARRALLDIEEVVVKCDGVALGLKEDTAVPKDPLPVAPVRRKSREPV